MATRLNEDRQYWLWVTRPEYYAEEDGSDRRDLDPAHTSDSDGWWTCHRDTRRGDLVLLWRTRPRSDIGYLIQTKSDAYSLRSNRHACQKGWDYGCDYQVLYKFRHPITLQDLRDDPYIQDWSAYRGLFQRSAYKIPPQHWVRLARMASRANRGYRAFLSKVERDAVAPRVWLEEQIEEWLVKNLSVLKPFGYDLSLYIDVDKELTGRQLVCTGDGGRIDLLCHDRRRRRYVVIELKNVRAGRNTFGQIWSYVGWVQRHIARGRAVHGLVISPGCDAQFESSISMTSKISHVDLGKVWRG